MIQYFSEIYVTLLRLPGKLRYPQSARRQFIQRRGRVLRRSPGKEIAVIHDAIIVPVNAEDEKDQLSLLRSELVRSVEFASGAPTKLFKDLPKP